MPVKTLVSLANISFNLGIIGHSEYQERIDVAFWLADEDNKEHDPRIISDTASNGHHNESEREVNGEDCEVIIGEDRKSILDKPDWMYLVAFKKWYFTKSDPDAYPSIPHGHLHSATRKWPKLNPYTGRAFKAKHSEDKSLRLTKMEMKILWRTEAFRDFCRSHILWYMEAYPLHSFPVRNPLRFPRR